MKAKAVWFPAAGRAEFKTENIPALGKGWCLLKTLYSSVSPGTERLVLKGRIPPQVYDSMVCPYMGGRFPFPVKYGYSLVGEVQEGPKSLLGREVHVLHPHQNYCAVRAPDIYPIPQTVPAPRAALASNLETALNGIWDARVMVGEKALVVGFGIVGSLTARLLRLIPEVAVTVVDTYPTKAVLAEKMGFHVAEASRLPDDFDLAFHTSGSSEGLQTALDHAGFEGRIVEMSWFGDKHSQLSLGGYVHSRRLQILSSQVSHLPSFMRRRWDIQRRKSLVFQLLKNKIFDQHTTHSLSFSDLPDLYPKLAAGPSEGLNYLVRYDE